MDSMFIFSTLVTVTRYQLNANAVEQMHQSYEENLSLFVSHFKKRHTIVQAVNKIDKKKSKIIHHARNDVD